MVRGKIIFYFKVLKFNLVATEVVDPTRRSSVPVTVHLLDANDNGKNWSMGSNYTIIK